MIKIVRSIITASLPLILLGCETTPVETTVCPAPVVVACPVCDVMQCPDSDVVQTVIPQCAPAPLAACPKAAIDSRYQVIGEKEWVLVEPGDLVFEARIDTGADTSSIHAEDIQLIEKDGKRWVRFTLTDPATKAKIPLERLLHRRIMVKQKTEDMTDRRYVVRMWVTLGETRTWLDVSLSDRNDFEFPVLIGRNMLMDSFAVDVSTHHTLPKPAPAPQEQ